ncbi:DUF2007 domain-containing protein [Labilibaculum sp. K2S]|uniref:putative signal transducing protein n=1 Tax=Labilibaculum sp. K2S TaxID=3056386 RepID=UPI0025A44B0D|nr:DUF2007 domain-containing protein [Labilibaculum sp. K2S]MDM8161770.1 DUF2007 domain-containing protein [Labilibaculum sp. K2S]
MIDFDKTGEANFLNRLLFDDMTTKQNDLDLIVIYSGSPIDSEIIKDILTENGIAVNIKNELMGTIAPWHVSAGGINPVEIVIFAKDKEQALRLIKEFNKGQRADL